MMIEYRAEHITATDHCRLHVMWLMNLVPGHCNSTYSTVDATRARLAAALGGAGGAFTNC
jgi:hypothetical protein